MYNGLVLHNAPWIKGLEPKDNCQRKAIQLTCINVKQTAAEFYKGERERERERERQRFFEHLRGCLDVNDAFLPELQEKPLRVT